MKKYKAFAKVNIFLKISGKRGHYHEIVSRFMRVENLYDTLSFVKKESLASRKEDFIILGDFECTTEQNTIYRAYMALQKVCNSQALQRLMQNYAIKVEKNIPAFAGLGGGSSDAATFLRMCNEVLHLGLSYNELAAIGLEVGADVPFFVYNYASANVRGIGEIVEPFDEAPLDIETMTPNIKISTPEVYRYYTKHCYNPIDASFAEALLEMPSRKVLEELTPKEANDLFEPALACYKELALFAEKGHFFSGSGSSFFWIKEHNHG